MRSWGLEHYMLLDRYISSNHHQVWLCIGLSVVYSPVLTAVIAREVGTIYLSEADVHHVISATCLVAFNCATQLAICS